MPEAGPGQTLSHRKSMPILVTAGEVQAHRRLPERPLLRRLPGPELVIFC
jgi:hypothetical protein